MTPKITWTQEADEGFLATVENPFDPGEVFLYRYRAAILDPDSPHFVRERGHKERAAIKMAMNEFNGERAWREYESLPEWLQCSSLSHVDNYPRNMRGAASSVYYKSDHFSRLIEDRRRDLLSDFSLLSPIKRKIIS